MADEIPSEALQAAAEAADASFAEQEWTRPVGPYREVYLKALAAAAPYLIAEGRRQALAEAITAIGQESDRVHALALGRKYNEAVAVGLTAAARMLRELGGAP